MQTVKVTLELTIDQAQKLFALYGGKPGLFEARIINTITDETVLKPVLAKSRRFSPGEGRGFDPVVSDLAELRASPQDRTGLRGRPSILNAKGMRKVWDLYNLGHSYAEIARGLNDLLGPRGVRLLVSRIKTPKAKS